MSNFTQTDLWLSEVLIFVCMYGAGLTVRFIFRTGGMTKIDPLAMPAYRQIVMPGFLRWLFLYKPVRGGVSFPAFLLQLPAYLTLGVVVVLAALFPSLYDAYWLPIVLYSCIGLLSIRFSKWLWSRQQHL
jgi:hypothetical protein